jgi:hypothetical protein
MKVNQEGMPPAENLIITLSSSAFGYFNDYLRRGSAFVALLHFK